MPRQGRRRKKTRTHVRTEPGNGDGLASALDSTTSTKNAAATTSTTEKVPKSVVMRRGRTDRSVQQLVEDLRHVMLPYTALHFREDPQNRKLTLGQYAQHLGLPMGVSHLLAFTQNENRLNLRLARIPAGPTLSFRIHRFSLNRSIQRLQRRPVSYTSSLTEHPPVVITNNFGDSNAAPHMKLLRITFQNMFPAINVASVKLTECRRVVLFNFQEIDNDEEMDEMEESNHKIGKMVANAGEAGATATSDNDGTRDNKKKQQKTKDQTTSPEGSGSAESALDHEQQPRQHRRQIVHMRHYAIKATPVGVNRRVRRLVQDKIPNLGKCQDIADYIQQQNEGGYHSDAPSDSEPEDDPNLVLKLPDKYVGKGNHKSQTSALKLVEIGPRLSMELIKVEKGLGSGDVLYHAHIQKSPTEAAALKEKHERQRELKTQRRALQQANVERKRQAAELKRELKRQKKEAKEKATMEALRNGNPIPNEFTEIEREDSSSSSSSSDERADDELDDGDDD